MEPLFHLTSSSTKLIQVNSDSNAEGSAYHPETSCFPPIWTWSEELFLSGEPDSKGTAANQNIVNAMYESLSFSFDLINLKQKVKEDTVVQQQ